MAKVNNGKKSAQDSILKGVFFGIIFGVILSIIFMLTKDIQGVGNIPVMVFRVLIFILTMPLAVPFFFVPVDGLSIDPYKAVVVFLVLNWVFLGALIGYLWVRREKIIPVIIVVSAILIVGFAHLLYKTVTLIKSFNA